MDSGDVETPSQWVFVTKSEESDPVSKLPELRVKERNGQVVQRVSVDWAQFRRLVMLEGTRSSTELAALERACRGNRRRGLSECRSQQSWKEN
jgi:hypothetical protein